MWLRKYTWSILQQYCNNVKQMAYSTLWQSRVVKHEGKGKNFARIYIFSTVSSPQFVTGRCTAVCLILLKNWLRIHACTQCCFMILVSRFIECCSTSQSCVKCWENSHCFNIPLNHFAGKSFLSAARCIAIFWCSLLHVKEQLLRIPIHVTNTFFRAAWNPKLWLLNTRSRFTTLCAIGTSFHLCCFTLSYFARIWISVVEARSHDKASGTLFS